MKDYHTAVMFEQAMGVRRLLEFTGKLPTLTDNLYINELRYRLDKLNVVDLERLWKEVVSGR